jgi:hypothetical protein
VPGGAPTIEGGAVNDAQPFTGADKNRLVIGGGGHFAYGSAPAVALGVRLSAELVSPEYSLALEGRYDLPASGQTRSGATARSSLAGAAIVPCVRARAVWACGVVLLSRVSAEASEANGTRVTDAAFFFGIGGRLQAHFALPWDFAIRVAGDLLVHPIAYELSANDRRLLRSNVVSFTIGPALVHAF